ncbi:polysaccharide deacetylase [Haladaptatus paucihalophilus DX253]|uniref:Polysaccharide deacetylase n=1 Tax=Haladaptatus paucihalophilus DX253 TaxID=797209 RepID=E7QXD2_HALPU|nr:polysaccharide deacetylase family protein [Haladaptatus paucihalophilus]EFW90935.1 polysaccharide deacetylase [Haladaptatus paucihalophilus DX253]SHK26630.1 Polysaccharide deacetylase [Haladaptatus paucihalophilus DX253]
MSELPDVSRRRFCQSAGALSLPLLGSTAAARSTDGRVVFIYDDSPEEDYTRIFPVHQDEGVPGCVAAVADRIGHSSWLSPEQLREMEREGWEMMSHSVRHRALGEIAVTRDVEPGETKLYVESNFHKRVPGDEIVVDDGRRTETFTVADGGEDSTGEYLVAEEPLRTPFRAKDGVTERYTDDLLRRSLKNSKETLEGFGVNVSSLVLPFGRTRGRVQELVPDYYDVLANEHHGGFNARASLDRYHLGRAVFRDGSMTEAEIGAFLDRVRNEDALGIFVGHSQDGHLAPSRVRATIRLAKRRNLEIVTLRDALEKFDALPATAEPTTPAPSTTRTTSSATSTASTSARGDPSSGTTGDPSDTKSAGDDTPSASQLGAVSLLGALGLGALGYFRRR